MANVKAVNISLKRGTIKQQMDQVELVENYGIEGDAHAGDWHRQVSLLDQSSVDRMLALGAHGLVPGIFAENITTEGMDLCHLPIGTRLEVGDAILEVTQIGKECHHHCQGDRIAVLPMQFRHDVEVHAVDRADQRGREDDRRP